MKLQGRFVGTGMILVPVVVLALAAGVAGYGQTAGQAPAAASAPAATEFHFPTPAERAALNAASGVERDRELKLLGITEMHRRSFAPVAELFDGELDAIDVVEVIEELDLEFGLDIV